MKEIDVKLSIGVEEVLGNISPILLKVDVKSNVNKTISVLGTCITIQKDYLLFDLNEDILPNNEKYLLEQYGKFDFHLVIDNLLSSVQSYKTLRIKVITDCGEFVSEKFPIESLKNLPKP